MDVRQILSSPLLYQKFQEWGGFFGARVKAMRDYLPDLPAGATVYDIGCGPGFIAEHLPRSINYHGFDVDKSYIEFAEKRFGAIGRFHHREFDESVVDKFGKADLVMMNGVLHHLDDEQATPLLTNIRDALARNGALFTLDGCFRDGQHPIARWMHQNDRGKYVRDERSYRLLLDGVFQSVTLRIREDLSWVPHTYCITVCKKDLA